MSEKKHLFSLQEYRRHSNRLPIRGSRNKRTVQWHNPDSTGRQFGKSGALSELRESLPYSCH